MRLYLSGPMTGKLDNNRKEFEWAAAELRKRDHDVISPIELDDRAKDSDATGYSCMTWGDYLSRDLHLILTDPHLDGLVLLDGWQQSSGATLEVCAAIRKGLRLFKLDKVCGNGQEWCSWQIVETEISVCFNSKRLEKTLAHCQDNAAGLGMEKEEQMKFASDRTTGHKDTGLRYDLLPELPLAEVALCYTLGSFKYAEHNWRKGLPYSKCIAALDRHVWKWKAGEVRDKDGQHHLSSVVFHALALMEFEHTHPELDDRWKSDTLGEDYALALSALMEAQRVADRPDKKLSDVAFSNACEAERSKVSDSSSEVD